MKKNSGTFYFASVSTGNQDWTTPHNDNLWQDAVKALFDPCPPDWRVPKSGAGNLSPWNTFTLGNAVVNQPYPGTGAGYFWNANYNKVWYPATGMRFYSGGDLSAIGGTGHYQSSTAIVGSVASYVFYFVGDDVIIDRSAHRTHCLSVRCIRE